LLLALLLPLLLLLTLGSLLPLLLLLAPGFLLPFLLLLLLAPGFLLPFLFLLALGLLLLFRLGLLLLFRGFPLLFMLLLLCIRGSNGSEKKEQNSRVDKSNWFHECRLPYGDFMRPSRGAPGAVIVCGGCLRQDDLWLFPPAFNQFPLRPKGHAGE